MPFLKQINLPDCTIGIWELRESVDELIEGFNFSQIEKNEFNKIKVEQRKKEFLATRLLAEKTCGFKPEIQHNKLGKPSIKNFNKNISISHCNSIVAIIISDKNVGIDAEDTNRNINRVANRFLSRNEMSFIETQPNAQTQKVVYWSAKEAIFKCAVENGIQFDKQIKIAGFKLAKEGHFSGELLIGKNCYQYNLWYFFIKNVVIVYCIEKNRNK